MLATSTPLFTPGTCRDPATLAAMMMLGMCQPVFRGPYVPCDREKRVEGAKILEPLLQHIPGNNGVKVMEDNDFMLVTKYSS